MQPIITEWFKKEKRQLPWRENLSPYAVWVSEIMLQQTQVSVVIPYFERWMQKFPTIETLAAAPLDSVIKAWEGLGYYSRARNLHAGARYVVENHAGQLPKDQEALAKIKGLGPYTVGAIRSFAFQQKSPAVDGNVIRLLARYFQIFDDTSLSKTHKKFWQLAEELLPEHEPWVFVEGLIELGALICTKKPKCLGCPLKKSCPAFQHGNSLELPYKSAKHQTEKIYRVAAVVRSPDEKYLIKRVQKGKVMSDLHEFPYFDMLDEGKIDPLRIQESLKLKFSLKASLISTLPMIQYSFTRYVVRLFPFIYEAAKPVHIEGYQWIPISELNLLAFSSGHRRLLHLL